MANLAPTVDLSTLSGKEQIKKVDENTAIRVPTATPSLKPTEPEKEEIQVNEEKQVLGETKKLEVRVVVPQNHAVNIRKKPSLESEILGRLWLTKKVSMLSEEK